MVAQGIQAIPLQNGVKITDDQSEACVDISELLSQLVRNAPPSWCENVFTNLKQVFCALLT